MPYGSVLTDTVQSSTAGTPPQFNDGNGTQVGTLCRAWVNYNGSTPAVLASFNVSSVTRNAAGDYTINFSTALPDANYCPVAGPGRAATASGYMYVPLDTNTSGTLLSKTTSAYRVTYQNVVGSVNTDVYMNVAVFR